MTKGTFSVKKLRSVVVGNRYISSTWLKLTIYTIFSRLMTNRTLRGLKYDWCPITFWQDFQDDFCTLRLSIYLSVFRLKNIYVYI